MPNIDPIVMQLSMLFWGLFMKKMKKRYTVLPEVLDRAIALRTMVSIGNNKNDFLTAGVIDINKDDFKKAKKCAQDCAKKCMDLCDSDNTDIVTGDIFEEAYREVSASIVTPFSSDPGTNAHGLLCTDMPPSP